MQMNTKNADEMTNEERLKEIVSILSDCLMRTINNKQKQVVKRSLTGLQSPLERSCVKQKKYRK